MGICILFVKSYKVFDCLKSVQLYQFLCLFLFLQVLNTLLAFAFFTMASKEFHFKLLKGEVERSDGCFLCRQTGHRLALYSDFAVYNTRYNTLLCRRVIR